MLHDGFGERDTIEHESLQETVAAALAEVLTRGGLGDHEPTAALCEAEIDTEAKVVTMMLEIELSPRVRCGCRVSAVPGGAVEPEVN